MLRVSALVHLHTLRLLQQGRSAEHVLDEDFYRECVTACTKASIPKGARVRDEIVETMTLHMPEFEPVSRDGILHVLLDGAKCLLTNAKNNIAEHYRRRVLAYVREKRRKSTDEYAAMTLPERRQHKRTSAKIARRVCSNPNTEDIELAEEDEDLAESIRAVLEIDDIVPDFAECPLSYFLKATPEKFLRGFHHMNGFISNTTGKLYATMPLKRSLVPGHIQIYRSSFGRLVQGMRNEALGRKIRRRCINTAFDPVEDGEVSIEDEWDLACVNQGWRVLGGFSTNGVDCIVNQLKGNKRDVTEFKRVNLNYRGKGKKRAREDERRDEMPCSGIVTVDQIKRNMDLNNLEIIGIDPGQVELAVAVNLQTRRKARYTRAQRDRDYRSVDYRITRNQERPTQVKVIERNLSTIKRSIGLDSLKQYLEVRERNMETLMDYYGKNEHRARARKRQISRQKSESSFVNRLRSLCANDGRKPVIAYGAFGAVAGRNTLHSKGIPPCIGVGLLRMIARFFLVVITPEFYTSRTCSVCTGECVAHPTTKRKHKDIRGLRFCVSCNRCLNRDSNAAYNIGLNLRRLLHDEPLLRPVNDDLIDHAAALQHE
jgi:hypothetical protein